MGGYGDYFSKIVGMGAVGGGVARSPHPFVSILNNFDFARRRRFEGSGNAPNFYSFVSKAHSIIIFLDRSRQISGGMERSPLSRAISRACYSKLGDKKLCFINNFIQ
jgi:hypothetical protein